MACSLFFVPLTPFDPDATKLQHDDFRLASD